MKVNYELLTTVFLIWAIGVTIILLYVFFVGRDNLDKEFYCAQVVCEEYGSYSYDYDTGVCECYYVPPLSDRVRELVRIV